MPVDNSPITFLLGEITDATIKTSTSIVGYAGSDNVATFTFTPASSISPVGGEIHIEAKAWYTSKRTKAYPMQETGFECSSSSFTEITKQQLRSSGSKKKWLILYDKLVSTVSESSPITI
jgi:hypothetical protein